MKKQLFFIFFALILGFNLQAKNPVPGITIEPDTNIADAEYFEALDYMDHETALKLLYKNIDDYLLPDDHPIKPALDRIFSSSHVLASTSAMKKAGFIDPVIRMRQIIVGYHPELQGYLLKVFLDTAHIDEVAKFIKRIEGARLIQKAVDYFGYNHLMKVPRKWLYRLPDYPKEKKDKIYPKEYVLVVDHMDIEDDLTNRAHYKSKITHEQLDALFDILTSCGLVDSTFVPNIPFTKDGYISFIDTEFSGKTMHIWLRINKLIKYLNSSNGKYWQQLIKNRERRSLPFIQSN